MVVRGIDWRSIRGEEDDNAAIRCKKAEPNETNTAERQEEELLHLLVYSAPWINSKFGCAAYISRQIVHGTYNLPPGYRLAIVPSDAQFATPTTPETVLEVSATSNLVKALIALVQAGYALFTLYRSQGDQVEHSDSRLLG
jgi:hypothetical protein